jgi:hypothetical protein
LCVVCVFFTLFCHYMNYKNQNRMLEGLNVKCLDRENVALIMFDVYTLMKVKKNAESVAGMS